MKSTVVDESLSSYQPMYCSREYQASTRLIQQYEKSTLNVEHLFGIGFTLIPAILIINFNFNYFTCVVICVGQVFSTLQSI